MTQGVFYSVLDSVNFNPARPHRDLERVRISAAGSLMLGLLVGDTRPVLTDAQIFDNSLIIDTVASFDREAEAFLGLIRDGRVQARILSAANLPASTPQGATLLDAFVAALQRPNFVFSAWPDLEQPDVRRAVSKILAGSADPTRELDSAQLAQRITAVRELSESFTSAARNTGLQLAHRPIFSDRLLLLLDNFRTNPQAQSSVEWLLGQAAKRADSLEYRSTWYRLMAAIPDSELGTLTRSPLLDGVNGVYNEAMARTLDCDPDISFSDRRMANAATAAGLKGRWGRRAVGLDQTRAVQDVVTWDIVRSTLPRLEGFATPQARLTFLINEFSESLGRERLERHTATWLRVNAPRQILAKLAAVGTAEAGLSVSTALGGSSLAEAIGALVGVVTVFGGSPVIDKIFARHEHRMAAREISQARMTLTRNSSAWAQRIDDDQS